ncbi:MULTISPECIES: tetratricopeptide repeat protein [unclassified Pseudomonas]|uniref:type III secretion apparatus assembly chaperone SctY n=1 Tax=unclassified Pseudomonas TaxID=196821 RepID=UPI000BD089C3|nr:MULTISPECIES: tetratricopeptide repeat protein [unclassified Pseudomonas]PVZ12525.1 type III secretion protein Y [Pseudomonas sp. URIL14HWK12:I12]PVZ23323.1 type III secretion protein Y [Pseudomonas sp. URIL14HWK12:I10]PVZ32653.1 type III secretion protein Y [Pseudomonas sp. URIL14HWK12:I11]SNZ13807.1 type III secretion protein Y [Pseudomonas sp. URIL14HWK12:I9]
MSRLDRDSRDLLRGMGELYRRAGQPQRALVMLLIAAHMMPTDRALLRNLALAFTDNGDAARALNALDRLQAQGATAPEDHLLRARALWRGGDSEQARACFKAYLANRKHRP